jgi:hypothetical protein
MQQKGLVLEWDYRRNQFGKKKKKIENVTEREERKAKGRELHTEHVELLQINISH